MAKLVSAQKISLKNHPEIKEDAIQKFIFDNPSVLGLGDVTALRREKTISTGGRLDILLGDDDVRYEVEIMLGATDPSHIIRTIEYWDAERKRYPQYDHCAVIVAEEITSRFMNVISLFNGTIPLIALQMTATKHGDDISLDFVKVLDRITFGTEDENEAEPTNRDYWEKKSDVLGIMDIIFGDVQSLIPDYELKYNKQYVGIAKKNGSAVNFIYFRPKKPHIWMFFRGITDEELIRTLEESDLQAEYRPRTRVYRIKFSKIDEYRNNSKLILDLVKKSMEYKNIEY